MRHTSLSADTVLEVRKPRSKKSIHHSAKTRRQRGYHWEDTIVKRFNASDGWTALRLGSPSTSLPDIMAVSTKYDTLYAIEAKSGTVGSLPVPIDQIERCKRINDIFDKYASRKIVLAFKFISRKRIGYSKYEWRPMREYYKIWEDDQKIQECVCTYEGRTYLRSDGKQVDIALKDCKVPFETRAVL